MSMEGVPKAVEKNEVEGVNENIESVESIERARELATEIEKFNDTDIVGSANLKKVEDIAHALSLELQNITAATCMQEGLPYHPTDTKSV